MTKVRKGGNSQRPKQINKTTELKLKSEKKSELCPKFINGSQVIFCLSLMKEKDCTVIPHTVCTVLPKGCFMCSPYLFFPLWKNCLLSFLYHNDFVL